MTLRFFSLSSQPRSRLAERISTIFSSLLLLVYVEDPVKLKELVCLLDRPKIYKQKTTLWVVIGAGYLL